MGDTFRKRVVFVNDGDFSTKGYAKAKAVAKRRQTKKDRRASQLEGKAQIEEVVNRCGCGGILEDCLAEYQTDEYDWRQYERRLERGVADYYDFDDYFDPRDYCDDWRDDYTAGYMAGYAAGRAAFAD